MNDVLDLIEKKYDGWERVADMFVTTLDEDAVMFVFADGTLKFGPRDEYPFGVVAEVQCLSAEEFVGLLHNTGWPIKKLIQERIIPFLKEEIKKGGRK